MSVYLKKYPCDISLCNKLYFDISTTFLRIVLYYVHQRDSNTEYLLHLLKIFLLILQYLYT